MTRPPSLSLSLKAHEILGKATEILIRVWQVVLSPTHPAEIWLLTLFTLCFEEEAAEMSEQALQ